MKEHLDSVEQRTAPSTQPGHFWAAVPHLDPAQAELENARVNAGGEFPLLFNGKSLTLRYLKKAPACEFSEVAEIWLGDHLLEVYFSDGALDRALDFAGYQQVVQTLSPQVAGIVLDKLIKLHMQSLESSFQGNSLVMSYLTDQEEVPDNPLYFSLKAEDDGSSIFFAIDTDTTTKIKMLSEFLSPKNSPELGGDFWVDLSARASGFHLECTQLKAMKVGDGLMLPHGWAPDRDNTVALNQQFVTPAEQKRQSFTLQSDFSKANKLIHRWLGSMSISQDDLEVEISVEIARGRVLANEVENLGEGSVLDLDILPDDTVLLLAGERPLAQGKLVRLNDRFAIKILKCL